MKRKIVFIEGPLSKQTKQNCYSYMFKIAKRNINQGKYPPNNKEKVV